MRIHAIKHVPFEGLAGIADWAGSRGHEVTVTMAPTGDFPLPQTYDLLVVMGGPMGVRDVDKYPWLIAEKEAVNAAIDAGRGVLGVCLGAQVIADALGAAVHRNDELEIGWYPVELTAAGRSSSVFGALPSSFVAGHWHGDTFQIPDGAVRTASSSACINQAFEYDDGRVVGVQFHLEWSQDALSELIGHAREELQEGQWVQTENELVGPGAPFGESTRYLTMLMDAIEGRIAQL